MLAGHQHNTVASPASSVVSGSQNSNGLLWLHHFEHRGWPDEACVALKLFMMVLHRFNDSGQSNSHPV